MGKSRHREFRQREFVRAAPRPAPPPPPPVIDADDLDGDDFTPCFSLNDLRVASMPVFEAVLTRVRALPDRLPWLSSDTREAIATEIELMITEFETL